jgi:3-oxoacyl-[acyl-carrier protein] reductase
MLTAINLTGRIALVTGGARGIGRAVALALAEAGADLAVNYVARAAEADAVAETIRKLGRRGLTVRADVSDGAAVKGMLESIARELGPPDVLINKRRSYRRRAPRPRIC